MSEEGTTDHAPHPSMQAPLVLDARSELLFFKSPTSLESWVEAVDVANGEYGQCWDSEGRLLQLRIELKEERLLGLLRRRVERVMLAPAEDLPCHLPELHQALLAFLLKLNLEPKIPATGDTADLLELAIEYAGAQ